MNTDRNGLPPVSEDEPPHPSFWNKKWPHPKFGRREPDELLKKFMEWYELSPSEFRRRKSRYQYVNEYGKFRCHDTKCLAKNGGPSYWTSRLTWVRFDLFNQTVRLFGQKCKKCRGAKYGGRYCYPIPFKYLEWRNFCLKAVDLAAKNMYLRDDVIDEDIEEGAFTFMTEEEQQSLMDSIVKKQPHQRDLCQRCKEREGPCWFPHKPEDCRRCQKDRRGLCYNIKNYQ